MALSVARIRALNAVIETGGFSAAAKRLGLSQPAVTQAVREIEREAGVILFDRRGRDLAPTALCAELYRITSQMQRSEMEAERLLQRHAIHASGEFRVGLGNAMPGMALIGEFRRRVPGIQVQVELGSWTQIIDAVLESRVDVGVLPNVPDDGRFERTICLRQDVVAVVGDTSPLAGHAQVSCEELMRHPLIFRTDKSSTQRVVNAGFKAAGLSPQPAMVLDTRDGVFEAAVNGLGVGFTWEFGSSREDKIRRLRVIEFEPGHPEHVFHISGRTGGLISAFMSIQI